MLLTDWIPILERIDWLYHKGYIPKFIGKKICDWLDWWYDDDSI